MIDPEVDVIDGAYALPLPTPVLHTHEVATQAIEAARVGPLSDLGARQR
jgi:hypothetical protein